MRCIALNNWGWCIAIFRFFLGLGKGGGWWGVCCMPPTQLLSLETSIKLLLYYVFAHALYFINCTNEHNFYWQLIAHTLSLSLSLSLSRSLSCDIDIITQSELPQQKSLEVTVVVSNITDVPGTIRLEASLELAILYYLIPVFAAVIIVTVVIFIVLVAIFCRKTRQKDRKYDQLILELEKLESSVAR